MGHHGYGENEATLGDRLTAAREGAGLSVAELADRLGVRAETMQGWEADQAEPRAVFLGRLSGMLGVPLTWLLTGKGQGPQTGGDGAASLPRTELRELRRLLHEATQRIDRLEELLAND
ncbi:helix-turn-helix domain-containing protein [Paracoccus stylophorae]|uniref:Helix-turn-helix domain-containing protein n=2 Tax=Paracoccus stylophorae TaxID=659350 RepID=A0ABY7T0F9_9RHOB|nr:helix-turn-helix domain-containing protein [Paracoccus stylophorae]